MTQLYQVGETEFAEVSDLQSDSNPRHSRGQPVLAGIYRLHETHGIPLEIILAYLAEHKIIPSFLDYYWEAEAAGMKHSRILAKLKEAMLDTYSPDYITEVINRLEKVRKINERTST